MDLQKKIKNDERELNDFLITLDNYKPTIPEAVSKYYLEKSGINIQDPRILSIVSLAADKFLYETVNDAKEQSLLRKVNAKNTKRKASEPLTTTVEHLETADLEGGLAQINVYWRKTRRIAQGNESAE